MHPKDAPDERMVEQTAVDEAEGHNVGQNDGRTGK